MLFPRVPGWYAGAGAGSYPSTPAWGKSASYHPTGTPSTATFWKSPQATGGWSSPTQPTGWNSGSTSQYGSYYTPSTTTTTFSEQPTVSPTTVPSQITDFSASPTPTGGPEPVITTTSDGDNPSLPNSSITESALPISSAPSSNSSAAQEFPEQSSGNTGAIICGVFFVIFVILSSATIAVYILRKRRSQDMNYRASKKLLKVRSDRNGFNQDLPSEELHCNVQARNIMISAPIIGGNCSASTGEFTAACPGFNERSTIPETNSTGITHSHSVGKFSYRSCASTSNSMLDPFMRYKYPRQQSPVPPLPRSPPVAYSQSFYQEERNFNSLNSSVASLLCKISPVRNEAPCRSSEDDRLGEKLVPRTSGVTTRSGHHPSPKRSLDLIGPEMPSYSRTSTFRSDKKSGSFGGTEGRNSGLTSFLDNYSYDRYELPQYPSDGVPQRTRKLTGDSSGSSSSMTIMVSDSSSQNQISYSPRNDLCALGLDFPGDIQYQRPFLGNCSSSSTFGHLKERPFITKGR